MQGILSFLKRYRSKPTGERKGKGQSVVEFALVGVILFMFLMGIMDAARLLFTYSVVSNAAQEGVRFGVLRPRDLLGSTEATQIAQNATLTPTAVRHTYVDPQVVADNACSAFSKTRENAFGLTKSDIKVSAWYDAGDGTPIPINSATPGPLENAAIPGNRIVVEATYHFDFIVPYMSVFVPNGINVTMRSARTIMGRGDLPYNCTVNYTPAPTYTITSTPSPSATTTSTPLPTYTPTLTPTPVCGLDSTSMYACRASASSGGTQPWSAYVNVRGFQAGDTVTVALNGLNPVAMTCTAAGACSYTAGTAANRTDNVIFTYTPAGGRTCGPLSLLTTFDQINSCSVSTPTPTGTFTPTVTRTPTITLTPTITVTPTPTVVCPLSALASAVRSTSGGFTGKVQPRVTVKDGLGMPARGLSITATTGFGENITLSEISPGLYSGCSNNTYAGSTTVTFSIGGTTCSINWTSGSTVTTSDGTIASCP